MVKKRVRRTQEIPEGESASARFTRVVTPRVGKAVKAIEVIGFCTGSTYEYSPAQASQIVAALDRAVKALEDKFAGKSVGGGSFSFTK